MRRVDARGALIIIHYNLPVIHYDSADPDLDMHSDKKASGNGRRYLAVVIILFGCMQGKLF